jgi:predicted small lipoprotein YifL
LAYGERVTRIATLTAAASLLLSSLPGCGAAAPAHAPEAESAAPAASSAEASHETPGATPAADAPAPEPAASSSSPAESLARDLVKSGGRRIGYSASKKRFVVPADMRTDGGRGLDLKFYDDEGAQREIQRVCQPGECEDRLDEIARELIPKLAARLEKEGYEPISASGWPSGRDELPIGALGGKLHYEKGRLSLTVDGKKAATPLRTAGGKAPRSDALQAVYPVPAAKLLGAVVEGDKEFYVFKLP